MVKKDLSKRPSISKPQMEGCKSCDAKCSAAAVALADRVMQLVFDENEENKDNPQYKKTTRITAADVARLAPAVERDAREMCERTGIRFLVEDSELCIRALTSPETNLEAIAACATARAEGTCDDYFVAGRINTVEISRQRSAPIVDGALA